MPTATWRQRFIRYLEAIGYRPDFDKPYSTKYVKMRSLTRANYYHLGRNGAAKISVNGKLKGAIPVTDRLKAQIVVWESKQAVLIPVKHEQAGF